MARLEGMTSHRRRQTSSERMRRSYLRVVVVWVAVLLALYAFQEYFS
jgi:hypothetical protein